MNFMIFENLPESIIGTIVVAIRALCFSISSFLYELMIRLYEIFDLLCTARLLDNDVLSKISSRIGLILGIVMLFNVVLSFIKMLIEPDNITSKDAGAASIIKKILIVIVMFGSFNFVFNFLYGMQKLIVENHIVSNFILPYQISDDSLDNFGHTLAYQLMFSFYATNDFSDVESQLDNNEASDVQACDTLTTAFKNQVVNDGKFDLGYACLDKSVTYNDPNSSEEVDTFIINYNYIFSVLVAVFVDYILLMYCFKVGVRMIQLMVLEIIAPVAILSYLSPKKETMFSTWIKIYWDTYLDVFIRIGIISFVIFLMATVFQVEKNMNFGFWGTIGNVGNGTKTIIEVIIILALLTFAKKAPDLIKELLPGSKSKLGFGLGMKEIVGLQKGVGMISGAAGGAAVGLLARRPLGAVGGLLKGGMSGFGAKNMTSAFSTGWKNQAKANKTIADVRANGGSWLGYQMNQLQQGLGLHTAYEGIEAEYADMKQYSDSYNGAKKKADSEVDKFAKNYFFKDSTGKKVSLLELDKMRTDNVHYTDSEMALFDQIYNQIHGFARDQAMSRNGALKSGEMIWEDTGSGNWDDIEKNRTDAFNTAPDSKDIARNSEIEAYMNHILSSAKAKEGLAAGNSEFKSAKDANDYYEKEVANKINDDKYKRAKANAGK